MLESAALQTSGAAFKKKTMINEEVLSCLEWKFKSVIENHEIVGDMDETLQCISDLIRDNAVSLVVQPSLLHRDLIDVLVDLKFGRPAKAQNVLDVAINELKK